MKKESKIIKIGKIVEREITQEMRDSYIDYAMSVIVSRALPDVRDGLKPVQRRILYTMYEMGLEAKGKFRKSATVVGDCMGKYHPHGDAPIYEALVRMAQDFTMRYPLVSGQGNFGSIDGDPPASMRYTEVKLSLIGEELLKDLEKNTVDFVPNYDGTRKEPVVLPSPVPNLLINGSMGIAVGMATNIPPHNLKEVCEALIYLLDHPQAETEDLFKFIKGPDFPTGGEIFDLKGIIRAYSQGKGKILVRGKAKIESKKEGKTQIIITEIPFQVEKSNLLAQLAKLVEEKKISGIRDIRDESDKEGLRIVIDLGKNVPAQRVLVKIFKLTELQKDFHLNILALVEGIQPKILNLVELLEEFLKHRKEVVIRKTKYDLERAKEKAHVLEGLKVCLQNIDLAIKLIKESKNREEAKKKLKQKFKIDEIQANAILETKLAALSRLERENIERELSAKKEEIKKLEEILRNPKKIKEEIKKELLEIKEKFGDERKTKVYFEPLKEIPEEELIPEEEAIVILSNDGYIKRISPKVFKLQKRGGKGILAEKLKEGKIEHLVLTNTKDKILFFTNSGKVFQLPVFNIPEAQKQAKGKSIVSLLPALEKEKVLSLLPLKKEESSKFLVFATKNGLVKKTPLKQFENLRKTGLLAISLNKNDLLRAVGKSKGEEEIFLFSKEGKAIRINEKEIRAMGRVASGIRGMKLKGEDEIVGMEIIKKENVKELLLITENGFGKRVKLKEFKVQKRGGMGIKVGKINKKTGTLIVAKGLEGEKELIIFSQKGQAIKIETKALPILKRESQGVKIMKLQEGDFIANAICY